MATGLLVVLASGVLAIAIVDARFLPLLAPPLALAGLWAVGRFPLAAVCAVVVLGATVVSSGRFKVPVGPLDLRLTELILGALLLVALVRPRRQWWGGAAGGALMVFLAVLATAAVFAVTTGRAHPVDAYHYSRSFAPVLLFFVVVRLFPEPEQARRLIYFAAVMAAVTGVVSLLAAAPGSPVSDFLDPSGIADGDAPPPSETTGMGLVNRVRLPGVALAYVLFWYAALRTMRAERTQRLPWLAITGGMAIALTLSLNRNMWVGLALGLLMVFALTHTKARRQMVVGMLVLVVIATLGGLSGAQVRSDSPAYPIVARFTTLFQPDEEVQDSSLTDRFYENRYALETIRDNPLTGVGPGAPYGLSGVKNLGNRVFLREDALFLHNQYLHLLLIGGPLALLSFLAFLLAPVVTGLRRLRHDDLFVALTVAIAMTLLSAIVMLSFIDATWSLVLGLLAGVLAVVASRPAEAESRSVVHA